MGLKDTLVREINQRKLMLYDTTSMLNLKNNTNEFIYKPQKVSQIQEKNKQTNKHLVITKGEKGRLEV